MESIVLIVTPDFEQCFFTSISNECLWYSLIKNVSSSGYTWDIEPLFLWHFKQHVLLVYLQHTCIITTVIHCRAQGYWLIDCIFWLSCSRVLYSNCRWRAENFRAFPLRLRPLSREGCLSCQPCYDAGPRFTRSHPKKFAMLILRYNQMNTSGS